MNRAINFRAWDFKKKVMIKQESTDRLDKCLTYYELNPKVALMQYTGLKDKNGVKIYEGDIVKHYEEYDYIYSEVYYSEGYWSPLVHVEDGYNCIDNYYPEEWEVIGNIYENPELCKQFFLKVMK